MAAAPDGPEEGAQQQEVVVGLLGSHGQLHGAVDNRVQVRLQHQLILRCEQRHRPEHQLEELQVKIRTLHVGWKIRQKGSKYKQCSAANGDTKTNTGLKSFR